jgi:hypothetical protein
VPTANLPDDSVRKPPSAPLALSVPAENRPTAASRLRVGALLDSSIVPQWVYRALTEIQECETLHLALTIVHERPQRSLWQRLPSARLSTLLFHLYERLDYQLFRSKIDAFQRVNASPLFGDAHTVHVTHVRRRPVDPLQKSAIDIIQEADLDVLIHFGSHSIQGEILQSARYGVWSLYHGDKGEYCGGPPLFWEMYEQVPIAGSILQILDEQQNGGRVIYRSFAALEFISLYRNRNAVYWKSAEFLRRRLLDLHRHGWSSLESGNRSCETDGFSRRTNQTPCNLTMARFLLRLSASVIRRQVRKQFLREQWFIAIRKRQPDEAGIPVMADVRIITPPPDRFYADPFLLKRGGRNYLFFEDYRYDAAKGLISCIELDSDGNGSELGVVLERPYHLSYPFLFEWQGDVYMIPETGANRTIELYRAVQFPRRWVLEAVLLDNIEAADATLLQHNGKAWLFANVAVHGGSTWDELFLFYADSVFGPWKPHPKNPIVSDVRRARPAGALYLENGQLIRPAQDCSVCYGRAVSLNRVDLLSETDYVETPIGRIGPEWLPGNLGTHTFHRSEEFDVLDGKVLVRK